MSLVFDLLKKEQERQNNTIELIASENFVSEDVLKAVGSCAINKYSEGYPKNHASGNKGRYYGGCQYIDALEEYCCEKWKEVFHTKYHVNVQPHSGSSANFAVYMALLNPGDTILSMSLSNGAHLSHGSPVNFSGKLFNIVEYNVDENGFIDYNDVEDKIRFYHPKLVLAGASAYSRIIDFRVFREIIAKIMAETEDYYPYFMVDMADIAGLVAAGKHPSPFGFADVITTTVQKTLRGPRGGLIFCVPFLAKKIDSAVFPGTQGGALQNMIAGKAVAAEEACSDNFKDYIERVVSNCKAMCNEFILLGYDIVTGGTDNHLFLIDLSKTHPNLTGKMIQEELDKHGITLNKNCVPYDKRSPVETSGIRIGTAAMTTKGWQAKDFIECARIIDSIIKNMDNKITQNLKKS